MCILKFKLIDGLQAKMLSYKRSSIQSFVSKKSSDGVGLTTLINKTSERNYISRQLLKMNQQERTCCYSAFQLGEL